MARKRAKPQAAPAVTPAQGEENLRRHNEYYALHCGLPKMFARERDFAAAILTQIKNTRLPEINKRAVIAETNSLLFHLDALDKHVQHGDIGQAVLAAVEVGRAGQMIVRMEHEHALESEINRTNGKTPKDIERKARALAREKRARDLWATEYSARVESGDIPKKQTACAKIADAILKEEKKRGEKPSPLSGRRVKDYLDSKTLDND